MPTPRFSNHRPLPGWVTNTITLEDEVMHGYYLFTSSNNEHKGHVPMLREEMIFSKQALAFNRGHAVRLDDEFRDFAERVLEHFEVRDAAAGSTPVQEAPEQSAGAEQPDTTDRSWIRCTPRLKPRDNGPDGESVPQHGYYLEVIDNSTVEQEIVITLKEYLALKRHLAVIRGFGGGDSGSRTEPEDGAEEESEVDDETTNDLVGEIEKEKDILQTPEEDPARVEAFKDQSEGYTYDLAMYDPGGSSVQEFWHKREEYIRLKRVLAGLEGHEENNPRYRIEVQTARRMLADCNGTEAQILAAWLDATEVHSGLTTPVEGFIHDSLMAYAGRNLDLDGIREIVESLADALQRLQTTYTPALKRNPWMARSIHNQDIAALAAAAKELRYPDEMAKGKGGEGGEGTSRN